MKLVKPSARVKAGALVLMALLAGLLVCDAALQYLCGTEPSNDRLSEAPAMVASGDLLGLTRPQVEALIGGPNTGKTFVDWDEGYFLRRDDACIDSVWLVIDYGSDGRVERAAITTD